MQVGFRSFNARVKIIEGMSEIEKFLKWYSKNHPRFAKVFYGWDPKRDNPDTADFSSFANYLTLLLVHRARSPNALYIKYGLK